MKKALCISALLLMLMLTACAGEAPAQNAPLPDSAGSALPQDPALQEAPEKIEPVEPVYVFEFMEETKSFTLPDSDHEYSNYSYSIPMMTVSNMDELSDPERQIAQRNVSAFNAEMRSVMAACISDGEQLAEDIALFYEETPGAWAGSDTRVTSVNHTGQIVSVVSNCYYYGGGVHPNAYVLTDIFDLSVGQFVDPTQVADDPEMFRRQVAQLLIEQADGLGEDYIEGFWDDYRSIISRWNDTAVYFTGEGMTVYFSAYELGPYAMGPVELFLSYEDLAEAIGPGGLAHLGVE